MTCLPAQDALTKIPRQVHLDRGALLQLVLRTNVRIRKSCVLRGGTRDELVTVGTVPTSFQLVYFFVMRSIQ